MSESLALGDANKSTYLLFMLGDQLFGICVEDVQSVEEDHHLTRVPLAGSHIGGVSQLHGHIITAIDMRAALKLAPPQDGKSTTASFIVEENGHQYSIMIDEVVGVFDLDIRNKDDVPHTVDRHLRKIGTNVLRHEGNLVLTTTAAALMEAV